MKECLFCGKRTDNNEWVEGWLFTIPTDEYKKDVECFIVTEIDFRDSIYDVYKYTYEVDPKTVRQFIGLFDKNKKRIYKGDIVRHYNDSSHPEHFEIGKIWWDKDKLCFKRTSFPTSVLVWSNCVYEVIGNIYDNPELLEQ